MSNKPVADKLQKALADNYSLYLKTQNYHWNVTGPHFKSLHDLFEEQYNDLFAANDDIAERIRILGHKVPASLELFGQTTDIKSGDENLDAIAMVSELANDQHIVIASLKAALAEAEKVDDEVTIDLMVERITAHEEAAWMLNATAQ